MISDEMTIWRRRSAADADGTADAATAEAELPPPPGWAHCANCHLDLPSRSWERPAYCGAACERVARLAAIGGGRSASTASTDEPAAAAKRRREGEPAVVAKKSWRTLIGKADAADSGTAQGAEGAAAAGSFKFGFG